MTLVPELTGLSKLIFQKKEFKNSLACSALEHREKEHRHQKAESCVLLLWPSLVALLTIVQLIDGL